MLLQIRELIPDSDIPFLARNLRTADKKEIKAFNGMSPLKGLKMCIEESDEVWVATFDGIPSMIYGISDDAIYTPDEYADNEEIKAGLVWALGTDEVFKYKKEFHRASKKVLSRFLNDFDVVYNSIWEGNTKHKEWLKALGFVFLPDGNMVSEQGENFEFFIKLAPIKKDKK